MVKMENSMLCISYHNLKKKLRKNGWHKFWVVFELYAAGKKTKQNKNWGGCQVLKQAIQNQILFVCTRGRET